MKKILFLLAALFSLGVSQGYAQALKTVRTYYDLFSARPYEVYTVNARTGQKHGTYNLYMEDGTLGIVNTGLPTARPPTKASPASRPTTSTTSCTDTIWST